MYKTKQTDQRVQPLFKLVLWLVLGRGSLYDSSLVIIIFIALQKIVLYSVYFQGLNVLAKIIAALKIINVTWVKAIVMRMKTAWEIKFAALTIVARLDF